MMRRSLLLITFAVGLALSACQKPPPPPNLVLIVIDTARADHFSCYGYPRLTTPRLDRFAHDAIRFEDASSVSSWTLPAHASLFTGLFPVTHRATQEHLVLDKRFTTLAELLHARGFATAGFSGNPWVSKRTNLARGFEVMREMYGPPGAKEIETHPHATNAAIFEWLRQRDPQRPFFLFVNYIEPHFPYEAPAAYEESFVAPATSTEERQAAAVSMVDWYLHPQPLPPRVAALRRALYDAELAYADAIVAELLAGLRNMELYDNSLIVVTSDHGENLGEHGHLNHVFSLYESTLRVPLIVRRPGGRDSGTVRPEPVQLPDVFMTLTAAAGITPRDARLAGRDLFGAVAAVERPLLAEYYYPAQALSVFSPEQRSSSGLDRFRRRLRSIRVGSRKLIWGSDGRHELYDLATDPLETKNLFGAADSGADRLQAQLAELLQRYQSPEPEAATPPPADAATQERLRALGYAR